jgi:hypothetical protein
MHSCYALLLLKVRLSASVQQQQVGTHHPFPMASQPSSCCVMQIPWAVLPPCALSPRCWRRGLSPVLPHLQAIELRTTRRMESGYCKRTRVTVVRPVWAVQMLPVLYVRSSEPVQCTQAS